MNEEVFVMDDPLSLLIESQIDAEVKPSGRPLCGRCQRPKVTCLCSHLPDMPLLTKTRVIVLQVRLTRLLKNLSLKDSRSSGHAYGSEECHRYC